MRTLRSLLITFCCSAALSPVVIAHTVALKDGRIIQFEKYRVTENLLLYTDNTGKEMKVLLSDVDLDRTRELTSTDIQPLNLPGLIVSNRMAVQNSAQSLGDVAKKMRATDNTTKAQRVFTDDVGNTAIFSVANSVLLEPLSYPNPDRLVELELASKEGNSDATSIKKRAIGTPRPR